MNANRHAGTSDVHPWIRFWARSFWDEEGGFEVEHRDVRGARVIGAIAVAVIVLLAAALTLAGA